ncbi:MAG: NUDIX domain-containing protein [Nitratireductor sp.]
MSQASLKIKLFHLWFRLTRPMTLGVRIIVLNDAKAVLLVKHGYVKGWHLPGGGVEVGQSGVDTVEAELFEETGLVCKSPPNLLGVFANKKASKRDHVLLYKVDDWQEARAFKPNREIKEIGFFKLDALPSGTTQATKARLEEVFKAKTQSEIW